MNNFPKKEHFLNPRLSSAFSRKVLKKLDDADRNYDRLKALNDDMKRSVAVIGKSMKIPQSYDKRLARTFGKYAKSLKIVSEHTKAMPDLRLLKKQRGKNCEACKKPKKDLQLAHVLRKESFAGPNAKYDEFRHHTANLLQLCMECRNELVADKLGKLKMKRILSGMRRRNRHILRDISSDSRQTAKAWKKLAKVDAKFRKETRKALAKSFNRI
jgi:hypothetical protein